VRVSTPSQRSRNAGEEGAPKKRRSSYKTEGYSEDEQIRRSIRHYVASGQAFRIYSDAGVTGEFPNLDPTMVKKLWTKKAARYRKIFTRALLDEQSLQRRTDEEILSVRAYLDRRVATIENGNIAEDAIYRSESEDGPIPQPSNCKPSTAHRQGFTQLWWDVEANLIHTITATDRSRIARDADLESAWLDVIFHHGTRLLGLIEDMSLIDVSDPLKKGLNYLIASVNEQRIEDISSGCFRGTVQLLENGLPTGKLPWWLERDEEGKAVFLPRGKEGAYRAVELCLSGLGSQAATRKIYQEGFRLASGKPISRGQIRNMLRSSRVNGSQLALWHRVENLSRCR